MKSTDIVLSVPIFVVVLNTIAFVGGENNSSLVVKCPPFEQVSLPHYASRVIRLQTTTEYCTCSLSAVGNGKTAIIKCDFAFQKDIILDDTLFPFKNYNIGSAYVRMTNSKSAKISSKFLSTWMDSPSSALDLWHCGNVTLEPTPIPHELQIFSDFKTFIGVGIIGCVIDEIPAKFLRDRNRGAIRIKDSHIGKISSNFLHNIQEMRYVIVEDTIIDDVGSPLSSSGVITLSRREIHAWDGMELINTSFKRVEPNAFNVTHKEEMEKFTITNCHFGSLGQGGLTASGDFNVVITNSSFSNLASLGIQISVNGLLTFTGNVIDNAQPDSLYGLTCKGEFSLQNNTIHIQQKGQLLKPFKSECGTPHVIYVESPRVASVTKDFGIGTGTIVSIVSFFVVALIVGAVLIGRNRVTLQYRYRRSESLLT